MTERERELIARANEGDDSACFSLGYMYDSGDGVEVDCEKAANWYKKGAEMDNISCILNLGYCYMSGRGVAQDYDLALKYSLDASERIVEGHIATIASVNAAIIYRISDKHRNYDKCEKMCLRAIEQDPDNEDGYFQLCLAVIFGAYSDFVSPSFIDRSNGKFSTVQTGRKGGVPIKEALEKYHDRFGIAAYKRLAELFYTIGVEEEQNSPYYTISHKRSGAWKIASQLCYLIEKEKSFDFNDQERYYDIYKVAELYAITEHPDQLRGHDHMIKLAENGFYLAFNFMMENNCPYYEKKIAGYSISDMKYKQMLMGRITYDNPLVEDIESWEKSSSKNPKKVEGEAFFIAVGYEHHMIDRSGFYQIDYDDTYKYYDKMDSLNPFAVLSKLRIKEYRLSKLLKSGEEKNLEKSAKVISGIADEYMRLTGDDNSKSDEAVARLRAIELLKQKSESCPGQISGNVFENINITNLGDRILPFKRNSKNLINMKIVSGDLFEYGLGDCYSWRGVKEQLYCCKGFDFLYRVRAEYPKEVLSNVTFNTGLFCKLTEELEKIYLSADQVRNIMLYLYETEGVLPKKYIHYVAEACERISADKGSGKEKNARADYYLFKLYSGKSGIKKDIEKSYSHLASAAKGGDCDAQYEAAILAKKGKLVKFGIEKSEYQNLMLSAAKGGNEMAKKKLK